MSEISCRPGDKATRRAGPESHACLVPGNMAHKTLLRWICGLRERFALERSVFYTNGMRLVRCISACLLEDEVCTGCTVAIQVSKPNCDTVVVAQNNNQYLMQGRIRVIGGNCLMVIRHLLDVRRRKCHNRKMVQRHCV